VRKKEEQSSSPKKILCANSTALKPFVRLVTFCLHAFAVFRTQKKPKSLLNRRKQSKQSLKPGRNCPTHQTLKEQT